MNKNFLVVCQHSFTPQFQCLDLVLFPQLYVRESHTVHCCMDSCPHFSTSSQLMPSPSTAVFPVDRHRRLTLLHLNGLRSSNHAAKLATSFLSLFIRDLLRSECSVSHSTSDFVNLTLLHVLPHSGAYFLSVPI
jgi:hypothetical protein